MDVKIILQSLVPFFELVPKLRYKGTGPDRWHRFLSYCGAIGGFLLIPCPDHGERPTMTVKIKKLNFDLTLTD